jgi:hypothetical protein
MLPGELSEAVQAQYLPTAIQGDLDSVRPDVLLFYRRHSVPINDLSGGGGGRSLAAESWFRCCPSLLAACVWLCLIRYDSWSLPQGLIVSWCPTCVSACRACCSRSGQHRPDKVH